MNNRFLSPSSLRLLLILALMAAVLFFPSQSVSAQTGNGFADCSAVTGMTQAECEALVALYNDAGGASWTNHTNWLVTSTPCDWFGVTCATGHATQLDLVNNGLIGTIPSELGDLTSLTFLRLSENQLSGTIPPELGSLTNLDHISLADNQLTGSLPPELGGWVNLTELFLYENQLSGSIPPEMGNMANLTIMSMGDNQLSGSIPSELGDLTLLIGLYLHSNELSGAFPASITNLVNLTDFTFDFCTGLGSTDPTVMAFLDDLQPGWNTCADIVISGDAGPGGVTLTYTDGSTKTVKADQNGLYSISVPYFWSGTVTPSKTPYMFNPWERTYTELYEDQTEQDYSAAAGIAIPSNAVQDGWVLANTVLNTSGGSFNFTDKTFRLGYDKNKRQYRSILSFDTSALPDDAVITHAMLEIRAQAAGAEPERSSTGIIVDIKKGLLGTAILESKDFNAKANKSFEAGFAHVTAAPTAPPPGWMTLDLDPGKDFINKLPFHNGMTQIRLRFSNTYTLANYLSYYSGNAPLASRPRLLIIFTVP